MLLAGRVQRQSDMREFGIGERHPRQRAVVDFGRQPEGEVPNDDAGVITSYMGELRPPGDVADGVNAPVAGPQPGIRLDALRVIFDAGVFEPEPFDIYLPARCHEDMRTLDLALAGVRDNCYRVAVRLVRHGRHRDVLENIDSFSRQRPAHDFDELRLVLRQDCHHVEHGHAATEPTMSLRHLYTDRPTTDDHQMIGHYADVEDRLVGQDLLTIEAGDLRDSGAGTCRDDEVLRRDHFVAGLNASAIDKGSMRLHHPNSEPLEAFDGVMRRDGSDDARDMGIDAGAVGLECVRRHDP